MGKITVLKQENMSLGTGNVLACISTAAAASLAAQVITKRIEISQSGTATLQQIRAEVATRDTAGTLTMTSQAPTPVRPIGSPASGLAGNTAPAGGTGRSGVNSSADSGGTYTQIYPFDFANTAGYLYKPDDLEALWVPASTVCVVRLLATPTTTTGWTIVWVLDEN